MPQQRQQDRYEPMPGFVSVPAWLWRRLPPAAKAVLVALLLAAIGLAIAIGPDIERSKSERERADREQRLEDRAEREARIRAQQRPRFVNGPAATAGVPARRRLLAAASASVLADARRRARAGELRGPIETAECEPFPRNVAGVGADDSTGQRFGRYACLAVTAKFEATEASPGGALGHPYRLRIDFDSGSYALCKIAGRPAEGQLRKRLGVTVPRACGGGP